MHPHEKLEKNLLRSVARASRHFGLIEPGDRIAVAMSGGKDSHVLFHLLRLLARRTPFRFSVVALTLDQGQPGFMADELERYYRELGVEYRIIREDTFSIVRSRVPADKSYCSFCSRLRRAILYRAARELGATKLALGHHADDAIETLLLNLFFSGQLKSMPPRLRSDDGQSLVIRPLVYCWETQIAEYAEARGFPVLACGLCSTEPELERRRIKQWVADLSDHNPRMRAHLLAALGNVRPSHLLDRGLWQKLGIHEPRLPVGR